MAKQEISPAEDDRPLLNDSRIRVAELASECGSNGSVYTIIHEHLGKIGGDQTHEHMKIVSRGWSQIISF